MIQREHDRETGEYIRGRGALRDGSLPLAQNAVASDVLHTADMRMVEHVLGMTQGYVLDFSNTTFDEFFKHNFGIDPRSDRFARRGESKANRLRTILEDHRGSPKAVILGALLNHRDALEKQGSVDALHPHMREQYSALIERLNASSASVDESVTVDGVEPPLSAASWTGRMSVHERIVVVRELVPSFMAELDRCADAIERARFNDPETADAVRFMRELHAALGELLNEVDRGSPFDRAVAMLKGKRELLSNMLREGTKLTVVAPAMTFGATQLLALLTGIPIDGSVVSTVYGTMVGADVVKAVAAKRDVA